MHVNSCVGSRRVLRFHAMILVQWSLKGNTYYVVTIFSLKWWILCMLLSSANRVCYIMKLCVQFVWYLYSCNWLYGSISDTAHNIYAMLIICSLHKPTLVKSVYILLCSFNHDIWKKPLGPHSHHIFFFFIYSKHNC